MKLTVTSSLAALAAMLLLVPLGPGTPPAAPFQGAMLRPTTGGQCDFTMNVSPASATITSGQTVRFRVSIQNLGAGRMINVGIISISPQTKSEPAFHQPAYDIWLPANGTGTAQINVSASDQTVKGTYTFTVQGKDVMGGCGYRVTHSVSFTVTVA